MARTKKSGMLRSALAGGVGTVLVAALAACSSGSSAGSSGSAAAGGSGGAKSLGTVTLAMGSKSANMSLGFIAAQDGLFKKNGLNVKLVYAGTGALATAALVSGSAQFAGVAFNDSAWFAQASFNRTAWFNEVTFEGDARFVEATFKGLARCLRDAVRIEGAQVPSTKGVL